jgi:hypothetical protein
VVFKDLDYNICFKAENQIYLSRQLLNQAAVLQHETGFPTAKVERLREFKIFGAIADLLPLSTTAIASHMYQ